MRALEIQLALNVVFCNYVSVSPRWPSQETLFHFVYMFQQRNKHCSNVKFLQHLLGHIELFSAVLYNVMLIIILL